MKTTPFIKIWLFLFAILPLSIPAVIINSGDGTGNTTDPGDSSGWNYVGQINKGAVTSSVTYVGNNWFITANHIKVLDNPTSIIFDGNTHTITEWSSQLSHGGNNADLIMFRVDGSISMSDVSFYSGSLTGGTDVTMIGNGRNRQSSSTTWYVDTDPVTDVWSESFFLDADVVREGYKWTSGSTKRWGTNEVASTGLTVNTGYGISETFTTSFNDSGDDEAQGATYDSGGGVFAFDGSDWGLAGMMVAVAGFSGQPASTSVYGNATYIVDLATYQAEIESILAVPELSSLSLMGLMLLGCGVFYVKRKK